MKELLNSAIISSWKTTLTGIAIATLAYLQQINVLDPNQFTLVSAVLVALGLTLSKDSNK